MRSLSLAALILLLTISSTGQNSTTASHTLTVTVSNINNEDGNIGVLVFNSDKGWPDNRFAALKDLIVPAHSGSLDITIPGLPTGDYAVAVLHDVNKNHKMDRDWIGKPKEQWGMSNNPHALIKAPSFSAARFHLDGDRTIGVQLQ